MSNMSPRIGILAEDNLDTNVGDHPQHCSIGDAANPRGDDDDAGRDAADQIADAGDNADDPVQTEADRGAGNLDEIVENM